MKISISKPNFSIEVEANDPQELNVAIDSIEQILDKSGEKPIRLEDVLPATSESSEEDLELPFCPECNHPFDSCICVPERTHNAHVQGRTVTGREILNALGVLNNNGGFVQPIGPVREETSRALPTGILPLNIESILSQPVENHECNCETPCETCSCEHALEGESFSSEFATGESVPAVHSQELSPAQPRNLTLGEVLGLPIDSAGSILGRNNVDLNEAVSRISEAIRGQ